MCNTITHTTQANQMSQVVGVNCRMCTPETIYKNSFHGMDLPVIEPELSSSNAHIAKGCRPRSPNTFFCSLLWNAALV